MSGCHSPGAGPTEKDRAPLVARVLPDVAGFDRELDYLVPPEMAASVRAGCIVRVPLQGRKVRGWVTVYPAQPPAGIPLRPLAKATGWGPEPELVELAAWAAWKWAGRRRSLLVTGSAEMAVRQLPPPAVSPFPSPSPAFPGTPPPPSPGTPSPASPATPSPGRPVAPSPGRPGPPVGARPRSSAGSDLVGQARGPGTHILRLPPSAGATELVWAAAERGPVLVVAPTNSRAEAGCTALRGRGAHVALLPQDWAQARAGARVVIGARAAAWGPCPGLTSVIVLDAHDEGYVQEQAPTWDAPTVAAERARRAGAPCLWVSACPTVEMLAAATDLHVVSRAEERAGWATIRVVDTRDQDPRSGLYSQPLVEVLRDEERRVVCVLNRKGRAWLLDCAACRRVATCEHCEAALTMVGERRLACQRCGATRPVVCRSCSSDALRLRRPGVSRAREQLEALAGRPTGEFWAGSGPLPDEDVVVGTEAVLYREAELRRRGGVGAVAFLDFDQELLAPRYRASEEALALLARASRLLGGRDRQILVQTRVPTHPVLNAALLADPGVLAAAEQPVRRALRLPPFGALAVLAGPGAAEMAAGVEKLGSMPAPGPSADGTSALPLEVSPLAENRWVVRAGDPGQLADALGAVGRPAERVRVEVGPVRF